MLRRVAIVVVLFWAMSWAAGSGVAAEGTVDPTTLAAFGFIVLAAYTLGELAHYVHIPHITGYLLAGLFCGPHLAPMLNQALSSLSRLVGGPERIAPFAVLLSQEVVHELKLFDILAIALIAMEAGAALRIDSLKKDWRAVSWLSGAMVVLCLGVGFVYAFAVSGPVHWMALPFLEEATLGRVVAVAFLLGVMVLATSPPVTLAVVNETGAKGRFTDTLVSTVIVNNIQVVLLFAVAIAVAQALTGEGQGSDGGAAAVLVQLALSLALGAAVATLAAAALRWLKTEALLALVGICFAGAYAVEEVGADLLLTFLTAGALLNNATRFGDEFKTVERRLSGPVYVLFFTLIGADLHVGALREMAPFAFALVGLRLFAYSLSIKLAERFTPLPSTLSRYGWLGLAPQAGIALTVALAVGQDFPGWGPAFETLGLAAIALNEMAGPILLKASLGLAGEVGAPKVEEEVGPTSDPTTEEEDLSDDFTEVARLGLAEWHPEPGRPEFNPWGRSPQTGDRRLNELCRDLAGELQGLVRELRSGLINTRRQEAQAFIGELRREFLRAHRRAAVLAEDSALAPPVFASELRRGRAELASRWKNQLLDRVAHLDFRGERNAMDAIVRGLDQAVEARPVALTAALEERHLAPAPDDRLMVRIVKWWRRGMLAVASSVGVGVRTREVEVRSVARYHIGGRGPARLRDVAGLMALSERHLLARARNLFEMYHRALDALLDAEGAPGGSGSAGRPERVATLRAEMEEELSLAGREVDRLADETVRVLAGALGGVYRDFVASLDVAGTPSAPSSSFGFSRVYEQRQGAIAELARGLDAAGLATRGVASGLAMELELTRLSSAVHETVQEAALEASRDVAGKLGIQLERVGTALNGTITELKAALEPAAAATASELSVRVEASSAPLMRIVDEAVAIAERYRTDLGVRMPFEDLLDGLSQAVDHLTDRYVVVFDDSGPGGRGLPPRPQTHDLPFRDLVRSFLDAEAGPELEQLGRRLEAEVEEAFRGIQELDRVLAFNTELARTELELGGDGPLQPATREVVEQMMVGTLQRMSHRVRGFQGRAGELETAVELGVREAVIGNLRKLQTTLARGDVAEIRSRLAQRTLAEGRRELRGAAVEVGQIIGRVVGLVRSTVGEDTLDQARRVVGLPDPDLAQGLGRGTFALPSERIEVPVAYRRLFSDKVLEAGDLLTGREAEVARVRRVLQGDGDNLSRAVAVVGVGGMGVHAVVQALLRGCSERGVRILRHEFSAPVAEASLVDAIVAEAQAITASGRQVVVVVEGLQWLFALRPGGFNLLRRFVNSVVDSSAHIGWLVSADKPVWSYADRVVPLHDAFPERFNLEPMDVEALRRATLSRHAMSGYALTFRRPESSLVWWVREALASGRREQHLYEAAYFEALHRDSGGVLSVALRLWMASITALDVKADAVAVGAIPHPPMRALRQLPDEVLITLRQVARQGRITAPDHAAQFRVEAEVSNAFLARLCHWGLLVRDAGGCFSFHQDMAGPLHRVLEERELVG